MDLNTITVQDFKDLFFRDFPYLPAYSATALYNNGAVVYYSPTELFYQSTEDGTTGIAPPAAPWQAVSDDVNNYIRDEDITKAFGEAQQVMNQSLFGSNDHIQRAYLYLTAHYLVNDYRAAQSAFATGTGLMTSRSVGSVSESYTLPEKWTKSPILSFYTTSSYGIKYLSMVTPKLSGNAIAIEGTTLP